MPPPERHGAMRADRLRSFTDAVLAIVVTIMVLELRAPHDPHVASLRPLLPAALGYVLSFAYLTIYWNNHHHLLHAASRVTPGILWANAHLLFWLSLVPFVTSWMGETGFASAPTAAYGVVLVLAAVAYRLLQRVIVRGEGPGSAVAAAAHRDRRGRLSTLLYAVAIPAAFVRPWLAGALYVVGALLWLVPDRRLERTIPTPDRGARASA